MDRRVKRTTQILLESLLTLLEKKAIEKVTVKELCQLANVNRSTFYQYYDNPPAMLEKMQDEIMEQIKAYLLFINNTSDKVLEIVRYLYSKQHYRKIILEAGGEDRILAALLYVVYNHDLDKWKNRYPDMPQSQIYYLFTFAATGSRGIIVEWIKNGFQQSPDDIAHLIETLSKNSAFGTSTPLAPHS